MKRPLQVIHHRRLLQHRTKVKIEKQPWEISSRGYSSGSEVFRFRRASVCVPSRWKVLSGEFRRRPTEFVIKLQNPDRVGRRGLSEPREDFSRLPANAFPCLKFGRASACVPSRWKVLSGEFRRRPTALVKKFSKPDRVGLRGLSEPREDFSRLTTYAIPWLESNHCTSTFNKSTHG